MAVVRLFAHSFAMLALVFSVSASALTEAEVLSAIQNNEPNAAETVAAYAAELGMSMPNLVARLVAANPRAAAAIVAAAVRANPTNAGSITSAALRAVNSSNLPPADRRALQVNIIASAITAAPNQQANIGAAVSTVPGVNSETIAQATQQAQAVAHSSQTWGGSNPIMQMPSYSDSSTSSSSTGGGSASP